MRKQDFGGLQKPHVHHFLQAHGYAVLANDRQRCQCAQYVAINLVADSARKVRAALPLSEFGDAMKLTSTKSWQRKHPWHKASYKHRP